jgi:DNA-binding XRE family transcriptional regulator
MLISTLVILSRHLGTCVETLLAVRRRLGISQQQLAAKVGAASKTVVY